MHRRALVLIAALMASASAFAKAPKPPAAPPSLPVCAECHGTLGVATAPGVPHLNGQIPENIMEAMTQFGSGKRPSSTPEHTNPATAPEFPALAKYYGFQIKAERPVQPVDPEKVAAGAALYERRCTKCHLDGGREADHEAPRMAGQSLEYLQAQTTAFVTGKRKFPFLMDEAYQGLSPQDLERISHYFASQKQ